LDKRARGYANTGLGETPTRFAPIHSAVQLGGALRQIEQHQEISLVCINDDQPDRAGAAVKNVFRDWMKMRWGGVRASWEKDVEW
jgi:hypothetical protein